MQIKEYVSFDKDEICALYSSVGWTAYLKDPEKLIKGFENSLCVLAAYENGVLAGLIRAVGDGETVVFVQDLLVRPEYRRKGAGKALIDALLKKYPSVRQAGLITDDTAQTDAFYRACGFSPLGELGCKVYFIFRNN